MYKDIFRLILILMLLLIALSGCASIDTAVNYIQVQTAEKRGFSAYKSNDFKNAFNSFQDAADLGGEVGQFMLAKMYLAGEAVEPSREQYLYWMQKSADNGFPPASNLIGVAYLSEKPELAIGYLKKAAEKEHDISMYILGLIYANGTGVEPNPTEALRWFRLAQAQGFPVESEFLSKPKLQNYMEEARKRNVIPIIEMPTKEEVSSPEKVASPIPLKSQATTSPKATTSVSPKRIKSVSSRSLLRTTSDTLVPALSKREMVRAIQVALVRLGYSPGEVDGLYGNKTRFAIQEFQRKIGTKPDGRASFDLLNRLNSMR